VYLSVKKNMYMITANIIRLKGCIELERHRNTEARQYFQLALKCLHWKDVDLLLQVVKEL